MSSHHNLANPANDQLLSHFKKLSIKFKQTRLIQTALTHRSYLNEQRKASQSYERLEYLGDAVLELLVSEFLYQTYPTMSEGQLTSLRAKIVQTKSLAQVAQKLKLGQHLKLSRGEAKASGQKNRSLLADVFEAVLGAIYLDQGLDITRNFVSKNLLSIHRKIINQSAVQDWKSKLQEIVQAKKGSSPTYHLVKAEGPDHERLFTIAVEYFGQQQATATGSSKQSAEQAAAKKGLEKLLKKS